MEKQVFTPQGIRGIIRFYNVYVSPAVVKPGHIVSFTWLGQPILRASIQEDDDPVMSSERTATRAIKSIIFNLPKPASVAQLLADHGVPFERMP